MSKIPRALTIAGSDSGGGAGIQADLKTFAALGVHGMSALTAITAQNTASVTAIQPIDPEMVRSQIETVVKDIGVDAAKTGMLYSGEIISVVAEEVDTNRLTTVVDPVMIAKSGSSLLRSEAVDALTRKLLPLAAVVTPNKMEAEALSKTRITTVEDAKEAARRIVDLGAKAVVVKGGHLASEGMARDILFHGGQFRVYEARRIDSTTDHGTGCVFAAAITAELAKGTPLEEAVGVAKQFVTRAIAFGLPLGKGHGPVNPVANLQNEAERWKVLANLKEGLRILEGQREVAYLIPESQSNIGMALTHAKSRDDVAAVPGRIVKLPTGVKASSFPDFGSSSHVANTILAAMNFDPTMRSAMNVRYSKDLLDVCRKLGLSVSFYDRKLEPSEIKQREGASTGWGAEQAIKKADSVPDVIYHEGDHGKEPMAVVLGKSAVDVAKLVAKISKLLAEGS